MAFTGSELIFGAALAVTAALLLIVAAAWLFRRRWPKVLGGLLLVLLASEAAFLAVASAHFRPDEAAHAAFVTKAAINLFNREISMNPDLAPLKLAKITDAQGLTDFEARFRGRHEADTGFKTPDQADILSRGLLYIEKLRGEQIYVISISYSAGNSTFTAYTLRSFSGIEFEYERGRTGG
jgi:hypothetical protein